MSATPRTGSVVIFPVVGLIVGIALALLANYTLDSLADSSDTWHQIQHGTFFVGGIFVGYAVTALYRALRRTT